MGADLAAKCRVDQFFPEYNMGVVVVERPGYRLVEPNPMCDVHVVRLPDGAGDVSSTLVQELMRGKVNGPAADALTVRQMLHPLVEQRLRAIWKIPRPRPNHQQDAGASQPGGGDPTADGVTASKDQQE